MSIQRLILEDADTTYEVLVEPTQPIKSTIANDDLESYNPINPRGPLQPTVSPELRVDLAKVHKTIQGYTQYAIGAFKNLSIAEVEEITLKFKLKISAEGGIPMIASGKTESDFEIEVKCKFPEKKD
jgi:Trypsin-co-occurring domain 1